MSSIKHSYQPSLEDEPSMVFDARVYKTLREASAGPTILLPRDEDSFDDTFRLGSINVRRLREHVSPGEDSFDGQNAHAEPSKPSPGHFQRGVPTNNASSSKNYSPDHVRIIKGEHISLLKNGALNEAMDDDDHRNHILEHRYMLSDPKLTETMRSSLLEHIAMHSKLMKKGMKQTKEDLGERAKRRFGPGVAARVLQRNGGSDSKIPQDSGVDAERKRTSGMVSMESTRHESRGNARSSRFDAAMKVRRGNI